MNAGGSDGGNGGSGGGLDGGLMMGSMDASFFRCALLLAGVSNHSANELFAATIEGDETMAGEVSGDSKNDLVVGDGGGAGGFRNVAINLVTILGDGGLNGLLMMVRDGGDWSGMVLGFPGEPTGGMPLDDHRNDSNGTKQMRKRKK